MQRRGLIGSKEPEGELYPVGTDLVTKYIGRDDDGKGLFEHGTFNTGTGEIETEITGSGYGVSTVFMPVNPRYSYQKTRIADGRAAGRLYFCGFYDKNYNYISYIAYNSLAVVNLPAFPNEARYIRIATHEVSNNWTIAIVRTA